jgi:archaellum component FlaC
MVLLPNIYTARLSINKNGGSELAAKQSSDLNDIAQEIQDLLAEIHDAKLIAIKKVEESFRERLDELDTSYAMLLSLMSGNTPVEEEE